MKDKLILFLIESPGKIEKMTHILNDKKEEYKVQASFGHIIDLDPKKMSIDFTDNFNPIYIVKMDRQNVANELKKSIKNAKEIILASDPDREGEGISWGIVTEFKIKDYKRVTYNSITKDVILEALKNPRKLDMNLVHAQQTRRILDRIIGYKLSPLIGKHLHNFHLSAGRVQSVIVELIIDKENEIKDFYQKEESSYYKFVGIFFEDKKKTMKANLLTKKAIKEETEEVPKKKKKTKDNEDENKLTSKIAKISSGDDAKNLISLMMKSKYIVGSIREHESLRYPSPPFSTSTLQQEASRKFGFQSKQTMMAAQKLYEAGLITYMRTDSIDMSKEGIEKIGKFIVSEYGKEYHNETHYKAKVANTQEAHECVRVVDPNIKEAKGKNIGASEDRLYSLIWKRTVACQMSPAKFNVININIDISKVKEYYFMTQVEQLLFAGFLKVYNLINVEKDDNEDDENKVIDVSVPKKGTELNVDNITASQEYNKPPSRYSEASLINQLDPSHLNIGRPSTYSLEINNIQDRNYVEKKDIDGFEKECIILTWNGKDKLEETTKKIMLGHETNKFVPTSLGTLVNEFLMQYFTDIMDYKFTARMEDNLDKIAEGKLDWITVLKDFYDKFNPLVEKLSNISPTETSFLDKHSRIVGKHPKSGLDIIATIAKFGPVVKMCDDKKKCTYAPIKKPLTIENITVEDALKLFEWPKSLGTYENKPMTLNRGKFGYYLKYSGDETMAIKVTEELNEEDIINLDLDKAIKLIEENNKKNLWMGKDDDNKYVVKNGKYGDYVSVKPLTKSKKVKTANYKLPKDTVIKDLTLDKIQEIVKEAKSKKRTFKKKGAKIERTKVKTKKAVKKVVKKVVKKKEKKLSKKDLVEIFG